MAAYVFIDVAQKQQFIYKHNKLADNLYNSFIIKSVTERMELDNSHSGVFSLNGYLTTNYKEKAAFVYSGGGNSIIRFDNMDEARDFVNKYSGKVLREYPDLELYISLVDESEVSELNSQEKEKKIRTLLHQKADQLKDKRRSRFKRWTYGVEKIDETGHPLFRCNDKRDDNKLSKKYLHQKLKKDLEKTGDGVKIIVTEELQKYKKGEDGKSYIGVIVIDGNQMGEMVSRISTFEDLAKFSKTIDSLYHDAVVNALEKIREHVSQDHRNKTTSQSIYVTPVVMAGDDVCLILEAEYAIKTAAEIVQQIAEWSISEKYRESLRQFMVGDETTLKACAGVAIVKYNYPFFEAVTTAEELCHRAKESIHKVRSAGDEMANASFIDWEIVQGQVTATREYEDYVKHGRYKEKFHLKPLRIDQDAPIENGIYQYGSFFQLVDNINQSIQKGKISKSVLEDLKKVMYGGWEQYKLFFEMKQTDACKQLTRIVQDIYSEARTCCAAVLESIDNQTTVHTYVLNDVMDVLPFINSEPERETEEVQPNVVKQGL